MAYQLTWHIPEKVLLLTLTGEYSLQDAKDVNLHILHEIEQSAGSIILLIDVLQMNRPFNFTNIRDAQTYISHPRLQDIFVITDDRLMKLAMIVIFNLTRAHLHTFDSLEKATATVQRQLSKLSGTPQLNQ